MPPYSDNLYSAWDESDVEPIEDGPNQPEPHGPGTHFQRSRQGDVEPGYPGHGVSGTGGVLGPGHDARDEDNDTDDVLSPTDGYFHTRQSPTTTWQSPYTTPVTATSSNVPHIPNIWVEDPSLAQSSTADSKAREADQERLANRRQPHPFQPRYPSGSSSTAAETQPGPREARDAYHQASSSTITPYPYTAASYTPYAPQRTTYDEQFLPREAPPAYTPSPTSSSVSPSSPRNYNTFSSDTRTTAAMGGREETQGLLANEPQSMGSPEDGIDDSNFPWRDRLRSRLRHRSGRHLKLILVALLLAILTVGFVTAAVKGIGANHDVPGANNPSKVKKPVDTPPPKQDKDFDSIVGRPPMDPDDDFNWGSSGNCTDTQIVRDVKKFDVTFAADRKLVVSQEIRNVPSSHVSIDVHGSVVIRRVGSGTPGPSAVIDIIVNDDRIDVDVDWDADEQTLVVTVPRGIPRGENSSRPCLNLKITLWVPEDGSLSNLYVQTVHLGIALLDNLSISISERAKFYSIVGSIIAASTGSDSRDKSIMDVGAPDSFRLQSRFIEVSSSSGSVTGSWPLYDYLAIKTISGNIKVGVEPQEAAKSEPKPAILYINSASGDVEFREPIHTAEEAFALTRAMVAANKGGETDLRAETVLPPRDYRVDVHTASGSIKGAAAFSSTCGIKTTSGGINVDLLPVLDSSLSEDDSKQALLKTSSTSGTNDITVLDPLWIDSQQGGYVDLPPTPTPPMPPVPTAPWDRERYVPIGDDDPYSWIPGHLRDGAGGAGVVAQQQRNAANSRALRSLGAEHTTTSAKINVKYPAVWEGLIQLSSVSGKLSARGEGVEIISGGGHGWPKKPLVAKKGQDHPGWINIGSVSGNIDVLVGEE